MNERKEVIDFLKEIGVNYVARDMRLGLWGYYKRPVKLSMMWDDGCEKVQIPCPELFEEIQWNDNEPISISQLVS